MSDKREQLEHRRSMAQEFAAASPATGGFMEFVGDAEGDGALDHKTKELMSLAIGVAVRCEPCILWHLDGALEAGATEEEVIESLTVAVVMGGGPALMYATKAYEAIGELAD